MQLASALVELGRYDEAEAALRGAGATPALANTLGEVLALQGRSDEARDWFARAIEAGAADALVAVLNRAQLDLDRGRLAEAKAALYLLIDAYNQRRGLSAVELTAVGRACQLLGGDDPQLFKDALKAYDQAVAADPSLLEPRVRLAELFLEKYDSTEARASLEDVLEVSPGHPAALLAMARILHFEGAGDAMAVLDQALAVNPKLVPARVLRARLHLELEDYAAAEAEAEAALAVNPEAPSALAVIAAAAFLQGDHARLVAVRERLHARNPRYADLYNELADAAVRNRLYREAVDFARQAVALDPASWRGHGLEGLNLLRVGEIEEGRRKLEVAFAGDPYNVWIKNTLDLLDTFAEFRSSRSRHFELFIHGKEAALLAPYLGELADEAYEHLAERYRHAPPTPIRVEVFPSHADFSVRTVGLAGLGALGVSFGPVIAIDSPSARQLGTFNWGSTLWHELAHTFTLSLSGHRIPRWLTEGLSVLEERRARPGWADDVTPEFLLAYKRGELLPLAELNNGFVRPDSPAQIGFSYYQASLIAELIERDFGFAKLRAIVCGYASGRLTEDLFKDILGVELADIDRRLGAHLDQRFATALKAIGDGEEDAPPPATPAARAARADEHPDDFRAQLRQGVALVEEERLAEARPYLERAKTLFPDYAGPSNPYALLAAIHQQQGRPAAAAAELEALLSLNETDYESHVKLAALYRELGDRRREAATWERAIYVSPLAAELHTRLAVLYAELGEPQRVIRERAAVVALAPADRAAALYQLALAYRDAGELGGARRTVVQALEIAPGFAEAQALLLALHRGES